MSNEAIIYLIAVIVNNGIPALIQLIKDWEIVDPTLSDWEALKSIPINPDAV